jgi:cation-transporting ATPase E
MTVVRNLPHFPFIHVRNNPVQPEQRLETGRSYWNILRTNLFSFFNLILFAVSIVLLGFGRYNDAFVTGITALISALIRTVQEVRAKRQLEQIALLVNPKATVIREGNEQAVDAAALVANDLIHLRAGDQALADGVVVGESAAEIDESLLTGESDLVRKQPCDPIYSGSFCVSGDLFYSAEAVGAGSYANQLAVSARTYSNAATPLEQQVTLIIRLLMVLTVCMALIFYIGGFLSSSTVLYYVTGSAVLVGLVPYGFFLTISLAYTLGAVSIARQGAIVQRSHAVESFRHVDVLCMDKTGTLTANALQLHTVQPLGMVTQGEAMRLLGDFARSSATANATTMAIQQGVEGRQRLPVDEIPFASARKWSALAFDDAQGRGVFVLGALEMLKDYLVEHDARALTQQVQAWSEEGLRVLLFAYNPDTTMLHDDAGAPLLPSLQPLGLISLRDQLRPHARELLDEFARMGIRIKIISGDNPHTVAALAKQVGLTDVQLAAGPELAAMSDAAFEQTAEEATIFGRIAPEQKAHLVDALRRRGHYVAMMGDGVNDILALKQAKLSIALQSGSNATRSVADVVLLNDSYQALAPALVEGKRVINGLTNAMYLTLTRSFTYAFVIIGALMAGLDFPFEPAQTGVTLVTVGLPTLLLTLWARAQAKAEPLLSSVARFVLPVAAWTTLVGVTLFAYVYFRSGEFWQQVTVPERVISMYEQYTGLIYQEGAQQFGLTVARISAQTGLSLFLSIAALSLILFLEPPFGLWQGWRDVSPDRRPAWLALGLIVLLVAGSNVPAVAQYWGFIPLPPLIWRDITVAMAVWIVGLWLLWRGRWVDRLLKV